MEEYLKETKMLNFNSAKISDLVRGKGWLELDEFHKIKIFMSLFKMIFYLDITLRIY